MTTVTVHEAKTKLSELLRRVEAGEEIVIARGDKPVAVLRSFDAQDVARKRAAAIGCLAGAFPEPDDSVFFEPVDDEAAGLVSSPTDPLVSPRRGRKPSRS
jgi:prevent-host-death family protein